MLYSTFRYSILVVGVTIVLCIFTWGLTSGWAPDAIGWGAIWGVSVGLATCFSCIFRSVVGGAAQFDLVELRAESVEGQALMRAAVRSFVDVVAILLFGITVALGGSHASVPGCALPIILLAALADFVGRLFFELRRARFA